MFRPGQLRQMDRYIKINRIEQQIDVYQSQAEKGARRAGQANSYNGCVYDKFIQTVERPD